MGKKSLTLGIVLISISIFSTLGIAGGPPPTLEILLIVLLIFVVPWLIGGIFLLRRHFKTRKTSEQFEGSIIENNPEKTHFWGCPKCGGDTQPKDGRQYCFSCNVYLE